MQRHVTANYWALLISVLLLGITVSSTLAHGHVEVGKYELVIGFRSEPAVQGEPNGLDLTVTNLETGERVNGLAETLRVEIIYGSSSRELEISPRFGQEGAYTADLLPTAAGDYTWHIWGDIEGTPVDVNMTSSPDTFSSVQPKASISFPAEEPATADLSAQAAGAARSAQTALIVAGIGLLVAVIALIIGFQAGRAGTRRIA